MVVVVVVGGVEREKRENWTGQDRIVKVERLVVGNWGWGWDGMGWDPGWDAGLG